MDGDERRKRQLVKKRTANFALARASYIDTKDIEQEDLNRDKEDRISQRRASRWFFPELDQRNIADPRTRITLRWEDIVYRIYPKRTRLKYWGKKNTEDYKLILNGVSGSLKPGEIMAIMGPSGSGKTSLLNVLSGFLEGEAIVEGTILCNKMRRNDDWKHVIAYVPQDISHVDPLMTVRESIEFAAALALPSKYPKEERETRIINVMKQMGLDHIANSRAGDSVKKGISGGELKRLAVAMELIREPKIIFLDEPTSGLDAASARNLVIYLQRLAIIDKISIMMTIHQPRLSILSKFTSFTFMAKGRVIFHGDIDDAFDYFESFNFVCPVDENPADFFLDLVSDDKIPVMPQDQNDRSRAASLLELTIPATEKLVG